MFEVLVYLYETYYRPEAFPEPADLAKILSDIGFKDAEITEALLWLDDLAETTEHFSVIPTTPPGSPHSQRIYAEQEISALGAEAVNFVQSLEAVGILTPLLREVVLERAMAADESPLGLDQLRLIVLVVLWSRGIDPDTALLNPVFADENDRREYLLH